jgi:hypothetical protein
MSMGMCFEHQNAIGSAEGNTIMTRLVFRKPQPSFEYEDDIEEMQRVLIANGYEASRDDLIACWTDYSDSYAAGWMGLPSNDDELLSILLGRLDEQ